MKETEHFEHRLYELELRLLQPEVRHSTAELSELLAEEFIEVGSSGERFDRDAIITSLASEQDVRISISEFQARMLSTDIALATYIAEFAPRDNHPQKRSTRCSVWRLRNNSWQMVFHQGTPLNPA
jgi:hypothetical protein